VNRPGQHEQVEALLSAYLDDELTQAEAQRVELHLEECGECRAALREMRRIQQLTAAIEFRQPPEGALEAIEQRLSVRGPRWGGWALIIIGLVAWVVYGLALALRRPRWPTVPELLAGLVVIGLALLFLSVLRQRLLERRHDRYRRIRQ
jgi:anti-sigma factor RsiW